MLEPKKPRATASKALKPASAKADTPLPAASPPAAKAAPVTPPAPPKPAPAPAVAAKAAPVEKKPVEEKAPAAKAAPARKAPAPKPAAPAPVVAAKPASPAPAPIVASPAPAAPKAAAPVESNALPVATQPEVEGSNTMATAAETATQTAQNTAEKFQNTLADVQGRTKAAWEKSAKFYEELGDLTKGNIEALIASSKAAASAAETIGQDAAAYSKKSLEQATATFKNFASAKSPTELFQLQSEYARSAFDGFVAESSRFSEKLMKLAGDVSQPISSRFAVAAEKVKAATAL